MADPCLDFASFCLAFCLAFLFTSLQNKDALKFEGLYNGNFNLYYGNSKTLQDITSVRRYNVFIYLYYVQMKRIVVPLKINFSFFREMVAKSKKILQILHLRHKCLSNTVFGSDLPSPVLELKKLNHLTFSFLLY